MIYGWKLLVLLYPLNNIKIRNYFDYKPRFNGASSKNNLPRINDGAYVINLNDRNSKGTHCFSLFTDRKAAVYFDSFGNKYLP